MYMCGGDHIESLQEMSYKYGLFSASLLPASSISLALSYSRNYVTILILCLGLDVCLCEDAVSIWSFQQHIDYLLQMHFLQCFKNLMVN